MFKVWLTIQLSLHYIFIAKFGSEKKIQNQWALGEITGKNVDRLVLSSSCNVLLQD